MGSGPIANYSYVMGLPACFFIAVLEASS
ncbi:hypothetical protein [Robertmurraya sp. FSL W8-0741]